MKKLIAATFISLLAMGTASADQIQDYARYGAVDSMTSTAVNLSALDATAAGKRAVSQQGFGLNGPFDFQD
jgi:hypothetical protein